MYLAAAAIAAAQSLPRFHKRQQLLGNEKV
jgi:hypothetical protein